MDKFKIQEYEEVSNGLGYEETWTTLFTVDAYIDLLAGDDFRDIQNAFTEESTHILIIPNYQEGITLGMRVVDSVNRWYEVNYADNPVNLNHHNELYLKYGGVVDGF